MVYKGGNKHSVLAFLTKILAIQYFCDLKVNSNFMKKYYNCFVVKS